MKKAIEGCDGIHINLSKTDEAIAVELIVNEAKRHKIELISYISGSSVAEENLWFSMVEHKYKAEQSIIQSGIPYLIFRPTWFFESLQLMVRDDKAMMIGKQPHPSSWVAADDLARMIVNAYQLDEAKNKIFYIHGPEKHLMKDILLEYVKRKHPSIGKVCTTPIGMLKIIAFLSRNKELKMVAEMFSYFEKVKEMGDATEANRFLGAPSITFEQWLNNR